jgi:hypothetical protein
MKQPQRITNGATAPLRARRLLFSIMAALGTFQCSDGAVVYDTAYETAYLTDYSYYSDVAYSGYYWADPWAYDVYLYQTATPNQGASVGNAIRALARGEQVCAGQAAVTPKMSPPACGSGEPVRSGVTIVFDGCKLADSSTLSGTFDVDTMRAASNVACDANTVINLEAAVTVTNLTFTNAAGAKVVIPNHTATVTGSHLNGQLPSTVSIEGMGRVQVYDSSGTLIADHNEKGTANITYSQADRTYSTSGTINIQDNNQSGATATITGANVLHSMNCCRPTGGMLFVSRNGGAHPGQHNWTFGPSCGQASDNGSSITLPACQ